ncbi:MAG: response regulator, partial [Bacteroidota bacterium]
MKPSILYVEDEPFLAKIVKETLEQKSFNVIHVNHGSKAIETFQNQVIDLCVLDIMLPGKNGYDIAKEIRSIQADIPILFLSAKNQTEDVVKGFGVGGNDYVRKPFSMEELIVRINNLLSIRQNDSKEVKSTTSLKIGTQYEFFPSKLELHSNNG